MTADALAPPAPPPATPAASRRLWLAWVMLPLLATAYQLLAVHLSVALPEAAGGGWVALLAGRPLFWLLVAVELGCFVCWMRILAVTSLAAAFPLTAISYVLVIASDRLLHAAPISPPRLIGSLLILAGAALIACPPRGVAR